VDGEKAQISASESSHFRANTLDDLANAPSVEVTEPMPSAPMTEPVFTVQSAERPDLQIEQAGPGRWSVHVRPKASRVLLGLPVSSAKRVDGHELQRAIEGVPPPNGHCPAWIRPQLLPRIIPRRARVPVQRVLDLDLGIHAGLHEGQLTSDGLVYAELAERGWPWCTVGQILVNAPGQPQKSGSAVLVGPNLILTAGHAVPWDAPDGSWSMLFTPAYRATDPTPAPFGASWVEQVRGHVTKEDDVNAFDYVIAKLQTPLGNSVGWMGSISFGNDQAYQSHQQWMSVGYPGQSGVPFFMPNIEVHDVDSSGDARELETADFLMGGWSGGPLVGFFGLDPKVLGIASGHETELSIGWFHVAETNSVFAGGKHMVDLVKYGYANWPA
jgi:hypothetical protein